MLIVFEGGEGSGKSTQVAALAAALRADGLVVTTTFEPGATPVGKRIRTILLENDDDLAERAEALLFAADRAHHVATVILPALARGEIVLCDRFVDSSLAYQGAGRSLALDEVRALSYWAVGPVRADLTIVLDVPVLDGLARAKGRGAADRLEKESVTFHERVRQAFLAFAAADPAHYRVLDALLPVDVLAKQIHQEVQS